MKTLKKLFINLMACVMVVAACFSLTACGEDIRTVELDVSVYNYTDKKTETVTLTLDLYGHLANDTVDAIEEYLSNGYYDDAVIYQLASYGKQLMLGDLKFDAEDGLVQNDIKPEIDGEFTANGVKGTNLLSKRGYVGLWRTWYESDGSYTTSSDARDSGRATLFIPTDTIAEYDGQMCIFATLNLEDAANAEALKLIESAYSADNLEEYEVYFTGEFDAEKEDENYGLTYNCVLAEDFDEDEVEDLFKAEGNQYVSFNHYTVKLAVYGEDLTPAVKVVSASVK
jgi:cyclophilin family peptidyl-prolyl cis-trans isomerase